jgi:hypothetical protein
VKANTPTAISPIKESAADSYSDDRPLTETNPSWGLGIGWNRSQQQQRLAQLGVGLLSFDSFGSFGASGVVLDTLLPQLCYSIPSVNVAATALGAVYEMQASYASGSPPDEHFAASQYQALLRAMHRDLLKQPLGPIPLIMMCFMLGIIEVFLQQESNALFHLRAAFKLLQDRRRTRLASCSAQPDPPSTDFCSPEDDIEILFRTLDVQICSYALIKTPYLPAISVPSTLPSMTDLGSARTTLVQLVHACYNFTSTAYKLKYQPQSISPSMYIQQGRHIAHLSTWLEHFNLTVLPTLAPDHASPSQLKAYSHPLTLRMTALSTLIYLSCILCPYETAFDAHAPHFERIITDAEAVLLARHKEPGSPIVEGMGIDGQRFATGPGPVQPLFLTAWKCRHTLHRRRAIALLRSLDAGREGPWSGPREARVTSRIMELEESWNSGSALVLQNAQLGEDGVPTGAGATARAGMLISSLAGPGGAGLGPRRNTATTINVPGTAQLERARMAEITEPARISCMGMEVLSNAAGGRRRGPPNRVIVRFRRCRDVEAMLSYSCGHGGPGQDWNLEAPHPDGPCADNPHWEMWEEVLEF